MAWLEEIIGKKSSSGGKMYTIREEPWPDRIHEYFEFAHDFDGYAAYPETLGELANAVRSIWQETKVFPDELILLKSCLFYEARRSRFIYGYPSDTDIDYLDELVTKIFDLDDEFHEQ